MCGFGAYPVCGPSEGSPRLLSGACQCKQSTKAWDNKLTKLTPACS